MKHIGCSVALLLAAFGALRAAEPVEAHRAKQTVMVPMRDGVRLATDVFQPANGWPFPTILIRTPYNKAPLAGLASEGVKRGYAVVVQDCRGRFASEGENLPFEHDHTDGPDTMKWLLAQPWCNGKVGTWGGSAVGITQLLMVGRGAPQPACQHITVGAPSLYQGMYPGGVFKKALVEDWLRLAQWSSNALPHWVAHPRYDAYWRERDVTPRYARVNTPAVHLGGWYDIFAQGTLDSFVGYQTRGGPAARGKQKLVMGPWAHGVLQNKVGELTFPENAKRPPGEVHDPWRWYAFWLRGESNGAGDWPAVTYYVMGDVTDAKAPGNEWRTTESWPPPAVNTPWYLGADRTLSTEPAATVTALAYRYDPNQPAPTVGGLQLSLPAGPHDQRTVESREDVLVFTSAPLDAPLEVTGRVRARLWILSDAPDTDFMARLCDVYPDGGSFNICEGQIRARFRDSFEHERPLRLGEVYPLEIDLWSTSIIFNRGHRLRVHVTSSSVPGYDPNPNTGEGFRASDRKRPARNAVLVGGRRASHVVLPTVAKPR